MDHTLYFICLAGCCALPVVDAREKSLRGALSCSLFRTFACGSFRSWTFSPLPQSVPRKNPNYICNTAAHGGKQTIVKLSRPIKRVLCTPAQKSELHLQSFRARRQVSTAKLSRPRIGCFAPRYRSLKANTQAARVSESRPRNGCYAPPAQKSELHLQYCRAWRQVSAAKLSRPRVGCFAPCAL